MEGKPEKIRRAQLEGNGDVLSAMGRNGGKQTQLRRTRLDAAVEAVSEEFRERREAEERRVRHQANEHIVTPDGQAGDFPDGIIPPEFQ